MSMGRQLALLGGLLLWGCGGASPPAGAASPSEPPPSESGPSEPSDTPPTKAEELEAAPAAEDAKGAPAADAPLEPKELEAALQSLFADPGLLEHLHLKMPGRSPLAVAGPNLPSKLEVIVGSHHVKVVSGPKSKKDPVLVFTKIEREGEQVKLHYRFDVEGVEGRATVTHKGSQWELTANRLIEK